jgi:two-component system, response regulator PdtaR
MNHQVAILLVEDDGILALDIQEQLEADGYRVIGPAPTGRKALDLFRADPPDLLLCDILLRGDWDGIETAQRLLQIRPVPLIYLTALGDRTTIERAKATCPAAYLPKPFEENTLRLAIEMALNQFAHQPKPLPGTFQPESLPATDRNAPLLLINGDVFVKQSHQFVKIHPADIVYLEADDNYTTLITKSRKYAIRLPLSQVLGLLAIPRLVRVHRSYAVNIDLVEAFAGHEIRLLHYQIPVGRSYHQPFRQQFGMSK